MKIEHIALYVADLEKARQLFTRYFGGVANEKYVNEKKGFSSYFICFPDGPRLELMHKTSVSGHRGGEQNGYSHLAFSCGSIGRVDELTRELREAGFAVAGEPRTTGDGYYESSFLDLEGNLIELTI